MISKFVSVIKARFHRLSSKLIMTYVILTVIPMACLGYFAYVQYKTSIEEQIGEYMPRFLRQAEANIHNHINEIMDMPNLVLNSESILSILRKDSYQSLSDKNRDQYVVKSFLTRTYLSGSDPDILGVFILSQNRMFHSSKVNYTGLDWQKMLMPYGQDKELRGAARIILPSEIKLHFEGGVPFILIMKEIQDTDNRRDLGTMLIALKLTFMDRILLDFEQDPDAKMWLVNRKGEIIYHTDVEMIGGIDPEVKHYPLLNGSFKERKRDEGRLISVTESATFDGILIHSIPLDHLTTRTDWMRTITIIIFIGLVGVTTSLFIGFVLRITGPIKRLIKLMKEVEMGKLHVELKTNTKDEVGVLARSFSSMMQRIRELIERNYEIEIRQKQAELYALQSQINPHFMYNTLETINMAVEEGETDSVIAMVSQLGRMLRYSLGNKSKIVSIEEELQHVRDFLAIQKFRFEERLVFEINAKNEVERLQTPKFIIQPIVENAIKYGLDSRQILIVHVSVDKEFGAYSGGTEVVFRIRDNGPGIPVERLQDIEQSMKTPSFSEKDSQFGIANVNARIMMMYGTAYGVQLHSIDGIGTEVIVRIPLLAEAE